MHNGSCTSQRNNLKLRKKTNKKQTKFTVSREI
jgi:hypothetical protein